MADQLDDDFSAQFDNLPIPPMDSLFFSENDNPEAFPLDFDFVDKKDRLQAYTWYAMRECFALRFEIPREEVDMAALFPECKDYKQLFLDNPIPEHDALEYAEKLRLASEGRAHSGAKQREEAAAGEK